MSYKLLASGMVQRSADGACIPSDPTNLDWLRYQEFLSAGGVPLPADQAPLPDTAAAFVDRQRISSLDELDATISALPASQQKAFRLIQQLLKD